MMAASRSGGTQSFGGAWTEEKLNILGGYLDFYTTALKNARFRLVYVDAFAGDGTIHLAPRSGTEPDAADWETFIAGSAERALRVRSRRFDRLVFVEADPQRSERLARLRQRHPDRKINVVTDDANRFLTELGSRAYDQSGNWRGVLFVDPFGTQLDWTTVESIARLERLDMWLLFPVGAIGRMLPRSQVPGDVALAWEACLERVYGGDSWRELYADDAQGNLFGDPSPVRAPGVGGLLRIYKRQLKTTFGDRLLSESRTLMNSRNSPLFEFIFCVGNPGRRAIRLAKGAAKHLINNW